jgi:hypothetical protein
MTLQMLARSSASTDAKLKNVVESTAAVVFLGTPHRGSPDLAAFGEWARSVVSAIGMDSSSVILDALGLKTTDLERAQETFSGVWEKYKFQVKTFQEGLGLTGVSLGVLGNKVVPDYSSIIGDHRERAETLQANHMDMCRFTGSDDPNYSRVAGELRSIYLSVVNPSADPALKPRTSTHSIKLSAAERACLQSLWFPGMSTRRLSLEKPAGDTCFWLFEHETYVDWLEGRNRDTHHGLLWVKGKPGSGKSILMKEAFRRASLQSDESGYHVAAFFFNAKGDELEHSPLGVLRSLLYQLLPHHQDHLYQLAKIWAERAPKGVGDDMNSSFWEEAELRSFFQSIIPYLSTARTLIYIDALDECNPNDIRSQAYFYREITKSAYNAGVKFSICLSSRHFRSVTVNGCPEIIVEDCNTNDIATYVERRFELGIATAEPNWPQLRDKILGKSAGVFLWAVLVVDDVLQKWDDGKDMRFLLKQLDVVPEALDDLFSQMFMSLDVETRQLTVRLFQWAIQVTKPLRLYEWHQVMAFIRQPPPSSLYDWRESDNFTNDDGQLERQIRNISKGLVEVKKVLGEVHDGCIDTISICAGAGSLNFEYGETRVVQVIHESVRDFFFQSKILSTLDPKLKSNPIGNGHISIMATCLDYINIKELDALVQARSRAEQLGNGQGGAELSEYSQPFESFHSLTPPPANIVGEQQYTDHMRTKDHVVKPARWGEGTGYTSVFETLRDSSDLDPHINVAQWIANNQVEFDHIYPREPIPNSDQPSVSAQSQTLEAHPALLSYATAQLFTHARLAQDAGADASSIINRLTKEGTWARWVLLKEDVPQGTDFLAYVTEQGLYTWLDTISRNSNEVGSGRKQPHEQAQIMSPWRISVPSNDPSKGQGQMSNWSTVPPPLPPPRYVPVNNERDTNQQSRSTPLERRGLKRPHSPACKFSLCVS